MLRIQLTIFLLTFFLRLSAQTGVSGKINYNNPKDTTIVLLFKSGKYELDSTSKRQVETCYKKLIKEDKTFFYIVNISGFSDDKGKDSSNYLLSRKRALEVGKCLKSFSKDSVIKKTGTYDYMTHCEGVKYQEVDYSVPIQYEYFGESELKYKKIDSLNISKERKVLLRFIDKREACLGTFYVCNLPSEDKTFNRDSTIQIFMPKGYLDQFVAGHALERCKYDKETKLAFKFQDSLPTKENFCEKKVSSSVVKQKKPEIKIGSLSFIALINDTVMSEPVCKTNFYKDNKIRIRFSAAKIPVKEFMLYNDKHELIEYQLTDGFVEAYISLSFPQKINIYIKNVAFKTSNLIIKGGTIFSVSVKEPINQCEIILEKKETKKRLFSKQTTYSLIKFSKSENILYLSNPSSNMIFSTSLKVLKYNKRKDTYVLKKRVLKKLKASKK